MTHTNHTDSVEALVDEFEKTFVDFVGDIEFAEAFAHLADDPNAPFVLPEMCNWLRKTLTTLQATQSQQVEEVKVEKFIDGIIAATQWLIDNGHLKAGSELNAMMLKALTPNHQEPTHYRWNDKVQEIAERVGDDIRSQESNPQD